MKPLVRSSLLLALVIAPVGLGACQSASQPGTVTIALEDMRFVPNSFNTRVGEQITVTLVNRGQQRHDLTFPSLHMPALDGVEAILEPGETRTITLKFDEPGTHTFQCSLPGHAGAGMTGALFVRQ